MGGAPRFNAPRVWRLMRVKTQRHRGALAAFKERGRTRSWKLLPHFCCFALTSSSSKQALFFFFFYLTLPIKRFKIPGRRLKIGHRAAGGESFQQPAATQAPAPRITAAPPSAAPINRLLAGCPPHFLSRHLAICKSAF